MSFFTNELYKIYALINTCSTALYTDCILIRAVLVLQIVTDLVCCIECDMKNNCGTCLLVYSGALEQSIVEDNADSPLTPLPAPMEPIRTMLRPEHYKPQATANPLHSAEPHPSAIIYPPERKDAREEVVMPLNQSDSDDDNEGTDRFVFSIILTSYR